MTWYMLSFGFLALGLLGMLNADEKFYQNSIAAFNSKAYPNLAAEIPEISLSLSVANQTYAASNDTLYSTFIGSFSSSGPHALGTFSQVAASYNLTVSLNRHIGDLSSLWLELDGYDGLLIDSISCKVKSKLYEFTVAKQWLQVWQPQLQSAKNHGYEPEASSSGLPSSSTMLVPVYRTLLLYTDTGLL